MKNIYNYSFSELENFFLGIGEKKYRATQVFEWLYRHLVTDFEAMTNIKKSVIAILKEKITFQPLELVEKQVALDQTTKYLFKLADGHYVETVLMYHNYGQSVCVTSQVGCAMGCSFCASGELGKIRNLEHHEMVGQVLHIQKELATQGLKVSNVVVMGIGEPFDNYSNVINFLKTLNYPLGFEIGARHITVSTCGIVPKIKQFALEGLQINLAISLHAPNDQLRNQIMKINKVYPLKEVILAVEDYLAITKRRVTFEYILLKDVNDQMIHAQQLVKLLRGINCYVNLIPYNEVSTNQYQRTDKKQAQSFFEVLRLGGLDATLRIEHGANIDAACGQLRHRKMVGKSQ